MDRLTDKLTDEGRQMEAGARMGVEWACDEAELAGRHLPRWADLSEDRRLRCREQTRAVLAAARGSVSLPNEERPFSVGQRECGEEAQEARVASLEAALREAADDLDAAAAVMRADGSIQNAHWAKADAKRARAALVGRR